MISIIKSIFKVGDRIILVCTDGNKVEGNIHAMSDDFILIKDKNNLLKGVKSTMIEYFEQPVVEGGGALSSSDKAKHDLKIIDKMPLETLLQKDPRLKKRFPNLVKEQKDKKNVGSTSPSSNLELSDYIDIVEFAKKKKKQF